jgi:MFS family permease
VTLARTRVLVTAFFALDGFIFGSWVVCVPQVKAHISASSGGLGLALLGISAGALITMVITGRLCDRFGSAPVTVGAATLMSLAVMLPAEVTSVAGLATVLVLFGAGFGMMNVAANSAAVEIARQLKRPIIPSFHAAFSLGGLTGALAGGVVASVLSVQWHLAAAGILGLVVTLGTGAMLLRAGQILSAHTHPDAESAAPPQPKTARAPLFVALFGLIALCSAYGEGAMGDWAALHLRTNLHTSVGLAAAGYASSSAAMVIGRLSGTWLLGHAGQTRVLVVGALTAAAGMLLAALVPLLAVVIVGFVFVGLGFSNLFPTAIGQAGALSGPSGVATASTIGYFGLLAGPPTIGFLAERIGLPAALTTVSLLALIGAATALLARRVEATTTS